MNRTQSFLVLLLGLVLGAACTSATAANLQQVVTLDPGWNAIFIELEPAERDIETVFAGLPVASVWRWRPGAGGAQFVADPAEDLENIDGWFAWFPEPRPEAFLSNLFRIDGATAYLVKLEGSSGKALRQCIAATRRGGIVSVAGVYAGFIHGFLFGDAFDKGLTFRMGQTHVQRFMPELLGFIEDGRLAPEIIISHRMKLADAARGYEMFEEKQDDCRKVVLTP